MHCACGAAWAHSMARVRWGVSLSYIFDESDVEPVADHPAPSALGFYVSYIFDESDWVLCLACLRRIRCRGFARGYDRSRNGEYLTDVVVRYAVPPDPPYIAFSRPLSPPLRPPRAIPFASPRPDPRFLGTVVSRASIARLSAKARRGRRSRPSAWCTGWGARSCLGPEEVAARSPSTIAIVWGGWRGAAGAGQGVVVVHGYCTGRVCIYLAPNAPGDWNHTREPCCTQSCYTVCSTYGAARAAPKRAVAYRIVVTCGVIWRPLFIVYVRYIYCPGRMGIYLAPTAPVD